jgi:mitochondrial fission protein ELM1
MGHLAWADAFVVTADSISMLSEACSTGKPVYVIGTEYCKWKFSAFHKTLRERGVVRPFTGLEDVSLSILSMIICFDLYCLLGYLPNRIVHNLSMYHLSVF